MSHLPMSDASGQTVATIKGTNHVGINRVVWDLGYETLQSVKLRTPPTDAPWVEVGPRDGGPLEPGEDPHPSGWSQAPIH